LRSYELSNSGKISADGKASSGMIPFCTKKRISHQASEESVDAHGRKMIYVLMDQNVEVKTANKADDIHTPNQQG
jgi:hypothetical protein